MNRKPYCLVLTLWIATIGHVLAQTEFRNLDFELAQVPSRPSSGLPIESALPGWGGAAVSLSNQGVMYDLYLLDSPQIGIYDDRISTRPLFGNYSAFLMADIGNWNDSKAELFQTGLIPAGTKTLSFATTREPIIQAVGLKPEDWHLSLFINGEKRSYFEVERDLEHVIWATDVSPMAGSVAEIRFSLDTSLPPGVDDAGVVVGLDEIGFSPTLIPEPSLMKILLLGLGAAAYIKRSR